VLVKKVSILFTLKIQAEDFVVISCDAQACYQLLPVSHYMISPIYEVSPGTGIDLPGETFQGGGRSYNRTPAIIAAAAENGCNRALE